MKIRRFAFLLSGMFILLWSAGCAGAGPGEPSGESAQGGGSTAAAEAEAIFKNRCIQCHGRNLEGRMGDKSNLQQVGARLSREEIAETIRNGRDQMPSFAGTLSDEEIEVLSEWLSTQK